MTESHTPDGAPSEGAPEGVPFDSAQGTPSDSAQGTPSDSAPFDSAQGAASDSAQGAASDAESDELYVDDILAAAEAEAEDPSNEHLADLKRLTAEYANYRKRTEANREAERERAIGDTVKVLLPVLDDLDRAEKHGDLEADSPFATIAAKLRGAVEKLGLTPFGAAGDAFDPQRHEAIFQQPTPGVDAETVADVVEVGYTLGGTLIRAAKVVVSVPA